MQNEQNQNQVNGDESTELESLETQTTFTEPEVTSGQPGIPNVVSSSPKKRSIFNNIFDRFNIYLLIFILVVVLAILVTTVSYINSKRAEKPDKQQLTTEPLSQEALDQLRQTDVKVGDPKQVLTVESNAIFAGKVLIRDSLEVAGSIKAGSGLNASSLSVSGTSLFNQVQANSLQISGSGTIQGPLNVQNNLSVSGSGSFGGTLSAARLNIQDLQINGDLKFTRHIDAGGGTPGKSDGSALGGGGSSSVSGTDTAGSININTGGSPGPGCFVNINFTQRYNSTPHVVITPVGSAAGSISYYINRSSTGFSVCTTNSAPGGQNFGFDYIVID